MDSYDVVIIGTGAGGGTLARHLAPSGKRILLLERGDWLPRELQNWLTRDVFVENRYISPDTWYDGKGKPFQPQVHYFVGERRSSTARLCTGSARRTSASCSTTTGSRPRGRSPTTSSSRTTRGRAAVPGARRAGRGSDRAEGERAVPVPGRLARAADPAALGRPRGGGLPAVPRTLRDHAGRAGHAEQHVHPLRGVRRLSVPCPREVRRGGARRAPGARARKRHARHRRGGRPAPDEPGGH